MRAADGTKDLLWLTRLERGIWTAKSCDLTERLRRGSNWRCSGSSWQSGSGASPSYIRWNNVRAPTSLRVPSGWIWWEMRSSSGRSMIRIARLWTVAVMEDLVIDSVQFVCPSSLFIVSLPLLLIQMASFSQRVVLSDSWSIILAASQFDDVIVGRDVFSYGRFESLRRWCFPLWD